MVSGYNEATDCGAPNALSGGLITSITDPLQRVTQFAYWGEPGVKFGQLKTITYAMGTADQAVEWFEYDNYGNLYKQWFEGLPANQAFATWYQYDLLGRLTAIAQGPNDGIGEPWLAPQQAFDYDRVNNLTYERHGTREIVMTYDPRNRLSTVTGDADGLAGPTLPSIEKRFYNVDGELEESRDAEDNPTNYGYDALGYLDLVLLPETPEYVRPEIHFVNGALGDVLSETDPRGYTTFYEYSPRRELAKVTTPDPDGPSGPLSEMISSWAFDEAGQLKDETHAGHNTHREYDALGRLISETNPRGYTRSWVYDKNSNATQEIDEAGYVTQRFYDFRNRLKEVLGEDPDLEDETDFRPRTVYAYDVASRVTQETTYNNNLPRHTFFKYNVLSLPTEITDAGNNLWKRSYDAAGNLIEELDPLNNKTSYEYDLLHRPTKRLDPIPDGPSGSQPRAETRWEYNLAGWLIREYDPLNRLTTFAHDNLGQVVTTIDNLGRTFHRKHDLSGNLVETTDQDGFVTKFEVDALNRLVKETGADPDKIGSVDGPLVSPERRWEYDEHGNVWKEFDPLNRLTEHHYDAMGQRTWTQLPDPLAIGGTNGPIYQWVYDAAGYLQNEVDPLSQGKNYDYDRLHRRTSAMDESGAVTYFAFDQAGNLKSLKDLANYITTWVHDALDRVTSETVTINSEQKSRTFHYDAAGRMDSTTDRSGRLREFFYDGLSRLTLEKWWTGGQVANLVSYAYNAASELTGAFDSNSSYTLGYDPLGRLATVNNAGTPGAPQVLFTNVYDGRSNRTSVKATISGVDDYATSTKYDALSRPIRIQQFDASLAGLAVAPKQINLDYNAADEVTRIRRYAVTGDDLPLIQNHLVVDNTLVYDKLGRLETTSYTTRTSTLLASYIRQYDALSRVTYARSDHGDPNYDDDEVFFSYDVTSQVTAASHNVEDTEAYSYDANGNRQSSHLHGSAYITATNSNLLLDDGVYTYTYDFEGNRTWAHKNGTTESIQYLWDHRNRLTTLIFRTGGQVTKQVAYIYDLFDRRIGKQLDATGDGVFERYEWYAYDGEHIALAFVDLDGAGSGGSSLANRYLHGPAVDQIMIDEQLNPNGTLADILYPLTDHQGSVRDLVRKHTTLGAETVNRIRYDSFGNLIDETNSAVDHFFSYTGRSYDADALLYDYRARWYDPVIGRFLSEDLIGFAGGDTNLQRYVGNDPVNYVDSDGLQKSPTTMQGRQVQSRTRQTWPDRGNSGQRSAARTGPRPTEPTAGTGASAGPMPGPIFVGPQPPSYLETENDNVRDEMKENWEQNRQLRNRAARLGLTERMMDEGIAALRAGVPEEKVRDIVSHALRPQIGPPGMQDPIDEAIERLQQARIAVFEQQVTGVVGRKAGGPVIPGRKTDCGANEAGHIDYGKLDKLGRPTGVKALITRRMINTGTHADHRIRPPGFEGEAAGHARGHLLGRQLGGSGSERRNLVTLNHDPTNTPIMRGFESLLRMVVESGEALTFSATPIYKGDTLVPHAIRLQATGQCGFFMDVTITNQL